MSDRPIELIMADGKPGRPSKFVGAWRALADAYGGPFKLAEELGCSYQNLNRWALQGGKPSKAAAKAIARLAHDKGLADPLAPLCPKCHGLGVRPLTEEEWRARGEAEAPTSSVPCECQTLGSL